ncbi:Aep3 protein [Saccharomycopsis crataegensis]|uniref:Aep3 protein n=1 Tax=Saccharomycopsis crataegensis TaxID=43959 RepID=A0AAV5QVV9_9ASCO|nr:Aep3 protein [Saccharomycopsis crataegensis]
MIGLRPISLSSLSRSRQVCRLYSSSSTQPSDGKLEVGQEQSITNSNSITLDQLSDEDIKAFVPYVGKGSRFTRRSVAYYTKKLWPPRHQGDIPDKKLVRSDILYDNKPTTEAAKNMLTGKVVYEQNMFAAQSQYTYDILRILNEIISVDDLQEELQIKSANRRKNSNNDQPTKNQIPIHCYEDIPRIPNNFNPVTFENYIHTLTHKNFYYKKASMFDSLITRLLRELLRLDNPKTKHLQNNINIFNDVIYFHSKRKDLASMKEYFYQIYRLKLVPNTKTINLFLNSLSHYNSLPHQYTSPSLVTLGYLQCLQRHDLKPDLTTFTLIYNNLPEFTSKIMLIEFMNKKEIPITKELLRSVIGDLLNRMTPEKVIEFFQSGQNDYTIKNLDTIGINVLISQLLTEKKFEKAWNFYIESIDNKSYKNIKPHVLSLNLFVQRFAQHGRIDLCFGAISTFGKQFRIWPDIVTYHNLIKCSVKTGYHKYWRNIIRIIYHEAWAKTSGTIIEISSYWLTRARARSLTDTHNKSMLRFKDPLTEFELNLAQEIKENVVWENLKIIVEPSLKNSNNDTKYLETVQKLHILDSKRAPSKKNNAADNDSNKKKLNNISPTKAFNGKSSVIDQHLLEDVLDINSKNVDRKPKNQSGKRTRYLKDIKHKNIVKLYRRRVDWILNDPSTALKNTLNKRKLIDES